VKFHGDKSVFDALDAVKDEIEDVVYTLNLSLDELNDVLETDDSENKDLWVNKAIDFIREAIDKLQN
jgi:hypothetical protein